jgi:glycosyltransferase involved in cell wall biosynthesis
MGFKYGELDAALRQHGNYIVSLHDFNLICPRLYLLTTEREHCTGFECTTACSFGEYYISEYRKLASAMLGAAKSVICFSESTKNYFERILKQSFRWKIQPHGILGLKEVRGEELSAKRPSKEDPLRAVFLGFLPAHKGTAIIEELVTENILPDGTPVEWHVVGELFGKAPATVHQHGKYDRETLPEKFKEINPHVVIILSICPETYSLTLDEAWNTGVPVISTPLGAPGERVAKTGAGWVLPELSAHAVRSQLASIASNWDDYLSRREKVKSVPLIDTRTEGAVYRAFYAEAAPQKRARVEAIFERFGAVSLTKLPEPRLSHRILRRLLNRGIRLLERLRLRVLAERVLYGILPNKFMQDLKSLR